MPSCRYILLPATQAAVIKSFDEGTKPGREYVARTAAAHAFSRFLLTLRLRYGYAIVAGVRKAPLKVSKRMSATKVRMQPFTARLLSACPIRSVVPAPLYCRSWAFISDPEAQQGQAFSEACQLRSRHAHTVGLALPSPCVIVHKVTTV
jgi:hypothetical protein